MKLLKIGIDGNNITSISYEDEDGVVISISYKEKNASPRLLGVFRDLGTNLIEYYGVSEISGILRPLELSIAYKGKEIDKVAMSYILSPVIGERPVSFKSILRSWLKDEDVALIELVQSLAIDLCKPYGDQIPLLPLPLIEVKREHEMCLIGE